MADFTVFCFLRILRYADVKKGKHSGTIKGKVNPVSERLPRKHILIC
jgi:hypothetical protein